jgi:hypothetical protein
MAPGTGMPPEPADRNVGATSVARAFQPAGSDDFPVARHSPTPDHSRLRSKSDRKLDGRKGRQ